MNTLRTGLLMAALTGLFLAVGFALGGGTGMVVAFVFAGLANLWAYWNSDKALLSMYGAREVGEADAPDLVRLVRQLSGQAGLPMPKVFVVDNPQPTPSPPAAIPSMPRSASPPACSTGSAARSWPA